MQKIKQRWSQIKHKELWLDSMVGMTWGFIASLVVGTIVGLLGIRQNNDWSHMVNSVKAAMTYITPFAIGAGVAFKAKLSPLQLMAVMIGAGITAHSSFIPKIEGSSIHWDAAKIGLDSGIISFPKGIALPGDVFGAWITSVLWLYFFKLIVWNFMLDIIFLPLIGALFGIANSMYLTYATTTIVVLAEWVIEHTINKDHVAGIFLAPVVGMIMGLALSLPTSSAAMAFALKLHGDAATAAMAGTAAQMISFGVMTYVSTGSVQKAFAVGLGTSMLQMKNFMRKPRILFIPTIMSALMAILAVSITPLDFLPVGKASVTSGMGACSLYGQIFTLQENSWISWQAWTHVLAFQLFVPMLLTFGVGHYVVHSKQWITKEMMEI